MNETLPGLAPPFAPPGGWGRSVGTGPGFFDPAPVGLQPTEPSITKARWFRGASAQNMYASSFPAFATPFTVSLWFKTFDTTSTNVMIWSLGDATGNNQISVNLNSNTVGSLDAGRVRCVTYVGGFGGWQIMSTFTYTAGRWNHLVWRMRSYVDHDLYLNGQYAGVATGSGSPSPAQTYLVFGQYLLQPYYYTGAIAHFAAWNGILALDEIRLLNSGLLASSVRPSKIFLQYNLGETHLAVDGRWPLVQTNSPTPGYTGPTLYLPGEESSIGQSLGTSVTVVASGFSLSARTLESVKSAPLTITRLTPTALVLTPAWVLPVTVSSLSFRPVSILSTKLSALSASALSLHAVGLGASKVSGAVPASLSLSSVALVALKTASVSSALLRLLAPQISVAGTVSATPEASRFTIQGTTVGAVKSAPLALVPVLFRGSSIESSRLVAVAPAHLGFVAEALVTAKSASADPAVTRFHSVEFAEPFKHYWRGEVLGAFSPGRLAGQAFVSGSLESEGTPQEYVTQGFVSGASESSSFTPGALASSRIIP